MCLSVLLSCIVGATLEGKVGIGQHAKTTKYVSTSPITTTISEPNQVSAAGPPFPDVFTNSCFIGGFYSSSVINNHHLSLFCRCAVHHMCSAAGARCDKYYKVHGNIELRGYRKLVTMPDIRLKAVKSIFGEPCLLCFA